MRMATSPNQNAAADLRESLKRSNSALGGSNPMVGQKRQREHNNGEFTKCCASMTF